MYNDFKERMKILPKRYLVPQLVDLDIDSKTALLDKVYESIRTLGVDDEAKTVSLFELIWKRCVVRSKDEFVEFLDYNLSGSDFSSFRDYFYDNKIKPFYGPKGNIWDALQIAEYIVLHPSTKTLEENFPDEEELAKPLQPKQKYTQDTENKIRSSRETGFPMVFKPEGTKEWVKWEKDYEIYLEKANALAWLKSIALESQKFNEIFDVYWIGYRFSAEGKLLACNTSDEQEIIENALKLATDGNWEAFKVHFLEAIKSASGKELSPRSTSRAAVAALEGLMKALTQMDQATLGSANSTARRRGLISEDTKNIIQVIWNRSNRNNTRHSTREDQEYSLEEARRDLLEVSKVSFHIMDSIVKGLVP